MLLVSFFSFTTQRSGMAVFPSMTGGKRLEPNRGIGQCRWLLWHELPLIPGLYPFHTPHDQRFCKLIAGAKARSSKFYAVHRSMKIYELILHWRESKMSRETDVVGYVQSRLLRFRSMDPRQCRFAPVASLKTFFELSYKHRCRYAPDAFAHACRSARC